MFSGRAARAEETGSKTGSRREPLMTSQSYCSGARQGGGGDCEFLLEQQEIVLTGDS